MGSVFHSSPSSGSVITTVPPWFLFPRAAIRARMRSIIAALIDGMSGSAGSSTGPGPGPAGYGVVTSRSGTPPRAVDPCGAGPIMPAPRWCWSREYAFR